MQVSKELLNIKGCLQEVRVWSGDLGEIWSHYLNVWGWDKEKEDQHGLESAKGHTGQQKECQKGLIAD